MPETARQNQEFKALVEQIQSQPMPITAEEWGKLKRKHDPEWTEEEDVTTLKDFLHLSTSTLNKIWLDPGEDEAWKDL